MPEHRPGIAEAEIVQPVAVHIGQGGAARLGHQHREGLRPIPHPQHRHAVKERRTARLQGGAGLGACGGKCPGFARTNCGNTISGHTADKGLVK